MENKKSGSTGMLVAVIVLGVAFLISLFWGFTQWLQKRSLEEDVERCRAIQSLAASLEEPTPPPPGDATITCLGDQSEVMCSIALLGNPGKVCWTTRIACQNGAVATADICQDLPEPQLANRTTPGSAFEWAEKCDAVAAVTVENVATKPL